jgi:ubiquinone/menaquinone biosynthesis C-methylase UbiE
LDKETYQNILQENINLHHIEARHYEKLHPEEFNWFEQGRIWTDIKFLHTQIPGQSRVLDIGCGTGNLFFKLLAMGHQVWGVDISQDMVEVLQEKIPTGSLNRTKLFCLNVDDFISGCCEKFDLIVMSSVLHHLPDYLETLSSVAGLLAPGGLLYITHEPTQYALSRDRFLRKILWQADNVIYHMIKVGRIPNVAPRSYRLSDYHLYHGFQEERVLQACTASGFEVIKFLRYSSAMRLGLSCWLDSRVLKGRGQFCLIARKAD